MNGTHLLQNGHVLCGALSGHFFHGFLFWPQETQVTATVENTTCPRCLERIKLPSSETPEVVAAIPLSEQSAQTAMTRALEGTITMRDLLPLARKAIEEMKARTAAKGTA